MDILPIFEIFHQPALQQFLAGAGISSPAVLPFSNNAN
jgi:hypothetical protein